MRFYGRRQVGSDALLWNTEPHPPLRGTFPKGEGFHPPFLGTFPRGEGFCVNGGFVPLRFVPFGFCGNARCTDLRRSKIAAIELIEQRSALRVFSVSRLQRLQAAGL